MDRALRRITEWSFKSDGDVGRFSGYGSVFDVEDSYGDVIIPGAFKASLKAWQSKKRLPPMLLQHGGGFLGGATDLVPIGRWEAMAEDSRGLAVEGRLIALDTERGKQVYAAMKEGVLDGLSIGFRTKAFTLGTKPGEPDRTLKEIDLVELSVVTMPANDAARVDDVKSLDLTERDVERILRDAGCSRDQAKTIVGHGYRALLRDARATQASREIADGIRQLRAVLQQGV